MFYSYTWWCHSFVLSSPFRWTTMAHLAGKICFLHMAHVWGCYPKVSLVSCGFSCKKGPKSPWISILSYGPIEKSAECVQSAEIGMFTVKRHTCCWVLACSSPSFSVGSCHMFETHSWRMLPCRGLSLNKRVCLQVGCPKSGFEPQFFPLKIASQIALHRHVHGIFMAFIFVYFQTPKLSAVIFWLPNGYSGSRGSELFKGWSAATSKVAQGMD